MEFQYTAYDSFSTTSDCYADYFNTYFFFQLHLLEIYCFYFQNYFKNPNAALKIPENCWRSVAQKKFRKAESRKQKEHMQIPSV